MMSRPERLQWQPARLLWSPLVHFADRIDRHRVVRHPAQSLATQAPAGVSRRASAAAELNLHVSMS